MIKKISELTAEDVAKVYSGRHNPSKGLGCRCGCLGKYWVPKDLKGEYDTANDSQVKWVLKQVQASQCIEGQDDNILDISSDPNEQGWMRVYTVYLREGVEVENSLAASCN